MSSAPLMGSAGATSARRRAAFPVVIVVADPLTRTAASAAATAAGAAPCAVSRICDLERWPEGQIVIVDPFHLTRFWRTVGASEVILLATTTDEGRAALAEGATQWLVPASGYDGLTALLARLASRPKRQRGSG